MLDSDAKEARGDLEHAGHHAIHRKIWAQFLVIEVIVFLALAFGPVGGFPWFETIDGLARFGGLVLGELFEFRVKGGDDAGVEVFDELERALAGLRHPAQEC